MSDPKRPFAKPPRPFAPPPPVRQKLLDPPQRGDMTRAKSSAPNKQTGTGKGAVQVAGETVYNMVRHPVQSGKALVGFVGEMAEDAMIAGSLGASAFPGGPQPPDVRAQQAKEGITDERRQQAIQNTVANAAAFAAGPAVRALATPAMGAAGAASAAAAANRAANAGLGAYYGGPDNRVAGALTGLVAGEVLGAATRGAAAGVRVVAPKLQEILGAGVLRARQAKAGAKQKAYEWVKEREWRREQANRQPHWEQKVPQQLAPVPKQLGPGAPPEPMPQAPVASPPEPMAPASMEPQAPVVQEAPAVPKVWGVPPERRASAELTGFNLAKPLQEHTAKELQHVLRNVQAMDPSPQQAADLTALMAEQARRNANPPKRGRGRPKIDRDGEYPDMPGAYAPGAQNLPAVSEDGFRYIPRSPFHVAYRTNADLTKFWKDTGLDGEQRWRPYSKELSEGELAKSGYVHSNEGLAKRHNAAYQAALRQTEMAEFPEEGARDWLDALPLDQLRAVVAKFTELPARLAAEGVLPEGFDPPHSYTVEELQGELKSKEREAKAAAAKAEKTRKAAEKKAEQAAAKAAAAPGTETPWSQESADAPIPNSLKGIPLAGVNGYLAERAAKVPLDMTGKPNQGHLVSFAYKEGLHALAQESMGRNDQPFTKKIMEHGALMQRYTPREQALIAAQVTRYLEVLRDQGLLVPEYFEAEVRGLAGYMPAGESPAPAAPAAPAPDPVIAAAVAASKPAKKAPKPKGKADEVAKVEAELYKHLAVANQMEAYTDTFKGKWSQRREAAKRANPELYDDYLAASTQLDQLADRLRAWVDEGRPGAQEAMARYNAEMQKPVAVDPVPAPAPTPKPKPKTAPKPKKKDDTPAPAPRKYPPPLDGETNRPLEHGEWILVGTPFKRPALDGGYSDFMAYRPVKIAARSPNKRWATKVTVVPVKSSGKPGKPMTIKMEPDKHQQWTLGTKFDFQAVADQAWESMDDAYQGLERELKRQRIAQEAADRQATGKYGERHADSAGGARSAYRSSNPAASSPRPIPTPKPQQAGAAPAPQPKRKPMAPTAQRPYAPPPGPTVNVRGEDIPAPLAGSHWVTPVELIDNLWNGVQRALAPTSVSLRSSFSGNNFRGAFASDARALKVAETALKELSRKMEVMPRRQAIVLIDAAERWDDPEAKQAVEAMAPGLAPMIDLFHKIMMAERDRAVAAGVLQTELEWYVGRAAFIEDRGMVTAQNVQASKNNLEGRKSFAKQRTHRYFTEFLADGHVPISYNFVKVNMAKLAEMRRVVSVREALLREEAAGRGIWLFDGGKNSLNAPEDGTGTWVRANDADDPATTMYDDGTVTHENVFDKHMRAGINAVIQSLGINHIREMNIGHGGALGWAEHAPSPNMATKFNSMDNTIWHELGHKIDFMYDLWAKINEATPGKVSHTITRGKRKGQTAYKQGPQTPEQIALRKTIAQELRDLADLRDEGSLETRSKSREAYVRNRWEKMANLLEAFFHMPQRFAEVAPTVLQRLTDFFASEPKLRPLLDLRPSLVRGFETRTEEMPGTHIIGHFYVPRDIKPLWTNLQSKGLHGSNFYTSLAAVKNIGTQVLLSLSGFHFLTIANEAIITHLARGLTRAVTAKAHELPKIAQETMGGMIGATVMDAWRGNKILEEYRRPGTHPEYADIIDEMVKLGGVRSGHDADFLGGQHTERMREAFRTALESDESGMNKALAVANIPVRAGLAALELAMWPILGWYVPRMKIYATYLATADALRKMPAHLTADQRARRVSDVVDEMDLRYGQVAYDNHFINKSLLHMSQLLMLAPGWTGGTLALFARGMTAPGRMVGARLAEKAPDMPRWLLDALPTRGSKRGGGIPAWSGGSQPPNEPPRGGGGRPGDAPGPDGPGDAPPFDYAGEAERTMKSFAYLIGMFTVGAIAMGGITYLMTGERPRGRDWWAARTGSFDADGNPNRIAPLGYIKDFIGWFLEPVTTAGHKLSILVHWLYSMASNEDYFGNFIYDPDKSFWPRLGEVMKNEITATRPISISASVEGMRRGQPWTTAVPLSGIGFGQAKKSLTRTKAQNMMYEYRERQGYIKRTPDEVTLASAKQAALEGIVGFKDMGSAKTALKNSEVTLADFLNAVDRQKRREHPLVHKFKTLRLDKARRVYAAGELWERKLWYRPLVEKARSELRGRKYTLEDFRLGRVYLPEKPESPPRPEDME